MRMKTGVIFFSFLYITFYSLLDFFFIIRIWLRHLCTTDLLNYFRIIFSLLTLFLILETSKSNFKIKGHFYFCSFFLVLSSLFLLFCFLFYFILLCFVRQSSKNSNRWCGRGKSESRGRRRWGRNQNYCGINCHWLNLK